MPATRHRQSATAAAAAVSALLALAACSAGLDGNGGVGAPSADISGPGEVLTEGGRLLVWAWEPTLSQVVEDFEAAYPNVDVEPANVGTGNEHYIALQNAITAGSGVPDIAQVEYFALPQFTITNSLADLTPYGPQT
ncbi:extracellular solute-binding protein [Promicromonospora sp. NPDC057138]|uniref:extracellular solute-binding protein n=1 Tax=Promicromonospora sp. NPDC057138 TaxID=3346031 RepID=UPI00363D24E2